ncbi:hypothetical protein NYQ83_00750 [Afifella sp. JA880]|uniref:hypothetical protein n=1 Tax=Afifella sp. JA880 TaxID=2975280 RepID=UPI0021BA6357|nr:hypothetical protein [Afifella sp. JA880]MCT8265791.1 hypothetical protein [Afifella sp. JA880]
MRVPTFSDRSGSLRLPAMWRWTILFLALAGLTLAGCTSDSETMRMRWYEARKAQPPKGDKVYVCHAFSCLLTTPVRFSPKEIKMLSGPFRGVANAQEERRAISKAVQIFEHNVGRKIGTSSDLGGFEKVGGGDPTQMDCIDEATNTTSLLVFLQEHGVLKYHTVAEPVARGFFLDGRYPHATAVVIDTRSKQRWSIDSWPNANAEPPVIMTLKDWFAER